MPNRRPSPGVTSGPVKVLHALVAIALIAGSVLVGVPAAYAEDQGELTITKGVTGFADGEEVDPGDTFVYTITITCTNTGSGGCTDAVLTDPLPDGISLNGDAGTITIVPDAGTATIDGDTVTVTFTEPLTDPAGGQGLIAGSTVTIQIPVQVDDDISPDLNGQDVTNTATVDGTNTDPADDDFTVVPNVPTDLAASTDKAFDPDSAIAEPGTETNLTLTGGNTSNVAVDEITMTDPTSPPGAFEYLGLTGELDVTLPPGAEQVQIDCYTDGAWVNGDPGAPPAALPDSVDDPSDCEGVRIHFISTDGANIAPGVSGSIDIGLEQRENIADAGAGPISNQVSTTITRDGTTSNPATANDAYTLTSADLPLEATKTFSPDTVVVGGESTVTLGATNGSDRTLDSLSITEPGADPNMFENGVTFTGWGDVQWPEGATGATVTWTYANPPSPVTATADAPDTLPDPTPGRAVTGFTVTFTGPIAPGAEASIPFTVTAADDQGAAEVEHPNEITATSTAPGGFAGEASAEDTLTTVVERLAVEVEKSISPDQIFSIPGQLVTVQLNGRLQDFPASSVDANQIIVQDPADLADDAWDDAFNPTSVAATPIPADSTLTVQYWNGTEWVDVPGMVDIGGPQVFTGTFPPDVQENAQGIRFVYESEDGFPPGTEVAPNLVYELDDAMALSDETVENCAASDATTPELDAENAVTPAPCPTLDLVPPLPGNGADVIDKDWDAPKLVGERTGDEAGLTIRWSTSGVSNIDQMVISDVPSPSVAGLPDTVFDPFDLVRIDPIGSGQDPVLTYDRVLRVELFSQATGTWEDAPDDPCPAACNGSFPGYTLSAASQADTIAFRLIYEESPTRVVDTATAPPIGSGVAASTGNNRAIHPVFRIRDALRSDPGVPVVADETYNVSGEQSQVRNTARADVYVNGRNLVGQNASDIITITDVPVTATITKDWTGGPLGIPAPGTADFPAEYPTGRVSIAAQNTTPRRVDRLTITEPTGGTDPFDTVNLRGFVSITDPATIGATDLQITLNLAGGGTETVTRDALLTRSEASLDQVIGFTFVYSGRILEGGVANLVFDTRLRQNSRETDQPLSAGTTVDNTATTDVEDLVDYPDVDPITSTDDDSAAIDLVATGIGLEVTKTFTPDEQTEPDRAPVTVTLTGQPSGPTRTTQMVIVDEDPTFFNQYDFVGFGGFSFTAPIDRVQVDAYVGGTFTAAGGTVTNTGGAWVPGTPGGAPTLPAGVTPDQVQGLRFTFTRADGALWENPSTPRQPIPLTVQRRETLHTGGPVLTDLAGNAPAPGEENAGEASDTIQGTNLGADTVGGVPISATDDATDTILYRHSLNSVEVSKSPTGPRPPSESIRYTLTFTNTGDTPITNPVITDQIPSDADGPLLIIDPELATGTSPYTFALSGAAPSPSNGPAMPTDPAQITTTTTPDATAPTTIQFSFPDGTVLEEDQTYTVTIAMRFRPGLPGSTEVTNTAGITGDRPWDACEETLNPDTGACEADTTVEPTRAGALRGEKLVRAEDPSLGVANTRDDPAGCIPDSDDFYLGGCVPITKPGDDEIWRLRFTNTGNLPQDRLYAVDRLPTPGDTGAISSLPRDSDWTPIPKQLAYAGVSGGEVSAVRVYYDTDDEICTDDLELGRSCPPGAWTLIGEITDPSVGGSLQIPPDATAIKIEADLFDEMLDPLGQIWFDLTTTTPSQSATAGPDTIAWNTVAAAARTDDDGEKGLSPKSEGNKVGVALATGPLDVIKKVDGPAAEFAPVSFTLTVRCTSLGEPVDLGANGTITVVPDVATRVDDIPLGSECTVSENADAAGNPAFTATTVTIVRADQTVPVVIATNTYALASLAIAKDVADSAVDQDGTPLTYGPFTFSVSCTFPDAQTAVYATGFDADNPMTVTIANDAVQPAPFTGLPAGADCTATETDDGGAESTTSAGTTGTGTVDGTTTIDLTLTPDGTDPVVTNTVTFSNVFATGAVTITKAFAGAGAEQYGSGPFTVRLSCVDAADTDRTIYDGDLELNAGNDYAVTVSDLSVDSTCTVTETDDGGATTSTVAPAGSFAVTATSGETPVAVTVTNEFALAGLRLTKELVTNGDPLAYGPFTFTVACELDGEPVYAVEVEPGEPMTATFGPGETATFTGLPAGAECTATETDTDGAGSTTSTGVTGTDTVTGGTSVELTLTPDGQDDPAVTNTVTFINRFDVGSLRVIKTIEGDESQVDDDQLFLFQVSCQELVDGRPQPVAIPDDGLFELSIAGGLTEQLDNLPTSAVCTVTETDSGGADASVVEPGEVTIGNDTTVDVLATNTFDPPPDETDEGEDRLPSTGGPSLIFLGVGAALLLAGAGALLASRRRRRP